MKVFLPFTRLRSETYHAIPDGVLVPLTDRTNGYGQYFKERWDAGEGFVNVEQDVVPKEGLIDEMVGCQSEVCFASYVYPGQPERLNRGTYLGCVKISDKFIQRNPTLFDNQPMNWSMPEGLIWAALEHPCHHDSVLHLHVDSLWPPEEINRYG